MLFDMNLTIFVVCMLVASSLANPVTTTTQPNELGDFPERLDQSVKKLAAQVDRSLKEVFQTAESAFRKLNKIFNALVDKTAIDLSLWALDMAMREELFMMADGSHYVFPLNSKSELESEYKTVAIAVSNLYRNLKTMERTDKMISNITRDLVTNENILGKLSEVKTSPEKLVRTLLHVYINAMDHQFEIDKELSVDYKKEKSEAEEVVKRDPKMRAPFRSLTEGPQKLFVFQDVVEFLKDKATYRQAIANKMFLKQSTKHFMMLVSQTHRERYALARALIQMSQSGESQSKVNQMYRQALNHVGDGNVWTDSEDTLFQGIADALERDPELGAQVGAAVKQVEEKTGDASAFLHVDFSLL